MSLSSQKNLKEHEAWYCPRLTEEEKSNVRVLCGINDCGATLTPNAVHRHRKLHDVCKVCREVLPVARAGDETVSHDVAGRREEHLSECIVPRTDA